MKRLSSSSFSYLLSLLVLALPLFVGMTFFCASPSGLVSFHAPYCPVEKAHAPFASQVHIPEMVILEKTSTLFFLLLVSQITLPYFLSTAYLLPFSCLHLLKRRLKERIHYGPRAPNVFLPQIASAHGY